MKRAAPRKLWSTYRSHTSQPSQPIRVPPDDQWLHWSGQGGKAEAVWTKNALLPAEVFEQELRNLPASKTELPSASLEEVQRAASSLRKHRGVGID
eukprot:10792875-Karenia_brevis.AAC.1